MIIIKNLHWIAGGMTGFAAGICLSVWLHGGTDFLLLLVAINCGLSVFNFAKALGK